MEKTFSNELSDIHLHYKIWMSDNENKGILGDGKWQILKLIENKGSIKAACDELGYTYRRTGVTLKRLSSFLVSRCWKNNAEEVTEAAPCLHLRGKS